MIPAIGACKFDSSGERRLAERLEQKLDSDYLLWHNVPVGPKQAHPDFVVIHPRRGALILETKDWRIDTIAKATRQYFEIHADGGLKTIVNPLAQARHCAIQVVNALDRDKQLVHADGPHQGKLIFPWGYGVVFTRITRAQFEAAGLGEAIESHLAICQDEMLEATDAEAFQQRLWDMFPHAFGKALSLPQLDRVRWIMFPEIRVGDQTGLFDTNSDAEEETDLPDIMRVMDLQQEQLARSLGDGHRVIHGVAGSGKTMILGYRAQQLAQAAVSKPVLILCYNEPLAVKLQAMMAAKGLHRQVHVRNFHKWCRQQLVAFGQPIPAQSQRMFDQMVENVIRGVERSQIPSGQYAAVLIDEGHDFQPEWFKLVVQMVDPSTNSLLVLYDSAQSIYEKAKRQKFSFKSLGIQAQGRTTILRINYRNTRQILELANKVAKDVLTPDAADDDGAPLLQPITCGRDGKAPIVVKLPTLRDEVRKVAELLADSHAEGHAWGEMAILCRHYELMHACAGELGRLRIPYQVRLKSGQYDPLANTIKIMTMHASKGLEFPVVALPAIGEMPQENEDASEEARLFYVAATRATHRLIVTSSGTRTFGQIVTTPD
nr:3'-5' exonuclease [Ramlibacter agri]